jgi:polyhydroxybutyrate depolymerase
MRARPFPLTLVLLLALCLAGCSPDFAQPPSPISSHAPAPDGGIDVGASRAADSGGDATRPDSRSADAPPAASKGCAAAAPKAGTQTRKLQHGGLARDYDLYLPPSYKHSPTPLVFYFHPLLTNKYYHQNTGGQGKADKAGFIAVFPQGEGASWNAGACCGPANGAGGKPAVDDVGFVRAILDDVAALACVDRRRVYATGFSNGGFLSHRLGCEAADLFAAIAPVGAVNGVAPASCKPSRPVPVLMINGTTDALVPYAGGLSFSGITSGKFASVQETFDGWAQRDGCTGAAVASFESGKASCKTHKQCAGGVEVTQCTVEGGGHCYFGELVCYLGQNSSDLRAVDASWDFMSRFQLAL